MNVDAHLTYHRADSDGADAEERNGEHMPDALAPTLRHAGVLRTIVVQERPGDDTTDFLLELSERTPTVAGVVASLDFADPEFEVRLARRREHAALVGVALDLRERSDDWIRTALVLENLYRVASAGLPVDLALEERHVPSVVEVLEVLAGARFAVQHAASPDVRARGLDPWRERIVQLATFEDVHCKLSGLTTLAARGRDWTPEDLRPFVEHALETFGADRLMVGSDWPRSAAVGTYGETLHAYRMLLGPPLDEEEAEDVFGVNAAAFYDVALF